MPGRGAVGVVAGAPAWWVWDCPDRWPGVAFVGELSVSDFCSDWEDVLEGALVDFAFGADAVADAAAAL